MATKIEQLEKAVAVLERVLAGHMQLPPRVGFTGFPTALQRREP